MRLFNKGARIIQHKEGVAHPKKLFTVSDALGHKLKKQYRHELESLDDATAKFADQPTSGGKAPAAAAASTASHTGANGVSPSTPGADESPSGEAAKPSTMPEDDDFLDPPATPEEVEEAKSYGVTVAVMRAEYAKHAAGGAQE